MTVNVISNPPSQHKTRFLPFDEIEIEDTVPARFEGVVERFPDNIVLKDENHTFTYRELNKIANKVARAILAVSDDPGKPVIILTETSGPALAAIMGALKAGKIYILIDPSYPRERIEDILLDAYADVIVTDNANLKLAESIAYPKDAASEYQLINIDDISKDLSDQNLAQKIFSSNYANIFYTSGSTGKPKGVINNHRNILHGTYNATKGYMITPDDRILLLTSLSFGASISDIFGALLNGAALYMFSLKNRSFRQLAQWMVDERITMCYFVPTSFRQFAESLSGDEVFSNLRMIRLGGEAIYKHDVELYKIHFPDHCILRVGLASTEAGSICWNFIDKITEINSDVVPVGKPVEGMDIFLLDEDHQPVPPGEVGEISVRSLYISPGYWHHPDLNKIRFLPDPEGGDRRICLTGDLGKFLPDGTLLHIARKDTLVKIRGLRIESSEVEAVLLGLETIAEAVVVAQSDRYNEKRLIAYVVPSKLPHPTIAELRMSILDKLPDYMAPSFFVFLDSLPLTSSGKVNRLELPPPLEDRLISGQEYIPPGDEVESHLVNIFEKYLTVQPVGIRDDFFELGGTSLLAIRIVSDLERTYQKSITIPEFMELRNVEKIAKKIQNQGASSLFHYLVPVQATGSDPPLFCVPPSAATAMQMANLSKYLGEDQPLYGFEYSGMDGVSEPFTSIPMIARAFVQDLRRIQPQGPYYICGLCVGGIVAFEMAQQLLAKGHKVAFLGVLDSNFPPRRKKPLIYYYLLTKQYIAKIRGNEFLMSIPKQERGGVAFDDDDDLRKRLQYVFTTHHIARMGYASPPYPGVITRFSTDSPHARRATRGWEKITKGGLNLQMIPGGHGQKRPEGQASFMREPNIQVLAQKLSDSLVKARKEAETI